MFCIIEKRALWLEDIMRALMLAVAIALLASFPAAAEDGHVQANQQ